MDEKKNRKTGRKKKHNQLTLSVIAIRLRISDCRRLSNVGVTGNCCSSSS